MTRTTRMSSVLHALHEPGKKAVVGAAIALLALWVVSWALSYVELGDWSLAIALAIAVVKASLVVVIFMELLHVRPSVRIAAATAIVMLAILMGLVVADVYARGLAGP
jgi:cytochrome c oxidase subunit 4